MDGGDVLVRGTPRGMSETTPLIKAALNLRVGVGFDVYEKAAKPLILRALRLSSNYSNSIISTVFSNPVFLLVLYVV